jgi:hypothetical protein
VGWGGQLFVEAEAPAGATLGPALRAGLGFDETRVEASSPPGVAARFQWMTASLEGCPVRWASSDLRWALYPCLALHLGALRGHADGISRPRQAVSLWSDGGPVVRLRVMVTAGLSLEAHAALLVTFTRPTFEILDVASDTATATYTPSRLAGALAIAAAYRFW